MADWRMHCHVNWLAHRYGGGAHEFHGQSQLVVEQLQHVEHTLLPGVGQTPEGIRGRYRKEKERDDQFDSWVLHCQAD